MNKKNDYIIMQDLDNRQAGYKEGIVSIFVNMLLFALKLWAGIVTNSIALTADAWHTLSDSLSSIIVIISIKLSSKKPDSAHPFGYGRWEYIASIFIGFMLLVVGYDFMKNSIIQFHNKGSTEFGTLAIIVVIISILMKEALAQYAFYLWRKTNNLTLKADGWHHRTDALSSVIVLLGILFASQFWWLDSVLGAIISVMIFYASFEIFKESIRKLLGEEPEPELIAQIESEIKKIYTEELHPHHYHLHNYVNHKELTFHIKLNLDMSILAGHKIATKIENKIYEIFNISTTIHIEPLSK